MHASQRNTYRRSTLASQVKQLQAQLDAQKGDTRKALNARVKAQAKTIDEQKATIEARDKEIAALGAKLTAISEAQSIAAQ